MRVVALAGGTGSAKLLRGLRAELGKFTIVSNVGDDFWRHGQYICPDIDIAMYTLAGIADETKGWGIQEDTFNTLRQLSKMGEETWFNLGDKDLATSMLRTELLSKGKRLGDITSILCERLGVAQSILPCTDDRLETYITTRFGSMHLQEFWVKNHGKPEVTGVEYRGAEGAKGEQRVLEELERAERIVICPANPVTSILPILAVEDIRRILEKSSAKRIAISPMIGQAPVSGPAGKFMHALGVETDSPSVAKLYSGVIDTLIIDSSDDGMAQEVQRQGVKPVLTQTLMKSHDDEGRLARIALEA